MTNSKYSPSPQRLTPRLRLKAGDDIAFGPGKAQLLELIDQHRSISGAARAMGLSYRRAWLLVETMNRCANTPLVITATGGRKGGGAELSPLGLQVLTEFRQLEQEILQSPAYQSLAGLFQSPPLDQA